MDLHCFAIVLIFAFLVGAQERPQVAKRHPPLCYEDYCAPWDPYPEPTSTYDAPPTSSASIPDWLYSYTYTRVELPIVTAAPPSTTQSILENPFTNPYVAIATSPELSVPTSVPDSACMVNPENPLEQFSVLNSSGVPYVTRDGCYLTPLAQLDIPNGFQDWTKEERENWSPPYFVFQKPPNAGPGLYDLVLDLGSSGVYYVGMSRKSFGRYSYKNDAYLTTGSSNGQNPVVDENGRAIITTMFGVTCDGFLTISMSNEFDNDKYVWEVKDGISVFTQVYSEPAPEQKTLLLAKRIREAAGDRLRRRDGLERRQGSAQTPSQRGDVPRCADTPGGLYSHVRQNPSRPAQSDGCGSGPWAFLVPEMQFHDCCNALDLCYDDCVSTFEECNDEFGFCANVECMTDIELLFKFITGEPADLFKCVAFSFLYGWATSLFGASAFRRSTADRCECLCPGSGPYCSAMTPCPKLHMNNLNCGACGQTCDTGGGIFCSGGTCSCRFDVSVNDDNNCGACGQSCINNYVCQQGECVCSRDVQNDSQNCGRCGQICPTGTLCSEGRCVCDPNTYHQCGNTCVNFEVDPGNCGGCYTTCDSHICHNHECYNGPTITYPGCYIPDAIVNNKFTNVIDTFNAPPWYVTNWIDTWGPFPDHRFKFETGFHKGDFRTTLNQDITLCAGAKYQVSVVFWMTIAEGSGYGYGPRGCWLGFSVGGLSVYWDEYAPNYPTAPVGALVFTVPQTGGAGFTYSSDQTQAYTTFKIDLWCSEHAANVWFEVDSVSIYPVP